MKNLSKTKISLFYLATYLIVIGFGLVFAPRNSLIVLQSNADYGDVFPRVAGMLMSGLGFTVLGLIRASAYELYPATLVIRVYFLICYSLLLHEQRSFVHGSIGHRWAWIPADAEQLHPGSQRGNLISSS